MAADREPQTVTYQGVTYYDDVTGLKRLLANKEYISLRAKYDLGQLSFYGQITEIEKRLTGKVLTE